MAEAVQYYRRPRDWSKAKRNFKTAMDTCVFIQRYIKFPGGKPFKLLFWQKRLIFQMFEEDFEGNRLRREIIFSTPRKNGKSTFVAVVLIAAAAGPLYTGDSMRMCITANSRDQAGELYDMITELFMASDEINKTFKFHKRAIFSKVLNVQIKVVAANEKTSHGLGLDGAAYDEISQAPDLKMHSTIQEATAAKKNSFMISMATSSPSVHNPMQELINNYKALKRAGYDDGKTLVKIWQGDEDVALSDETNLLSDDQMIKSNPSYHHMESLREYLEFRRNRARVSPFYRARYRVYQLNLAGDPSTMLIDPVLWAQAAHPNPKKMLKKLKKKRARCRIAIDLSRSKDVTCISLFFPKYNFLHHLAFLPHDMLAVYDEQTGAPFSDWAAKGEIFTTPGPVIDYRFVAKKIGKLLKDYRVEGGRYDSWQWDQLECHLDDLKIPLEIEPCRQGFKTMNVMIIETENRLMEGRLQHSNLSIANFCWQAAEAKVAANSASDERMVAKPQKFVPIDCCIAGLMAIGDGTEEYGVVSAVSDDIIDGKDDEVQEFLSDFLDSDPDDPNIPEAFAEIDE